MIKKLTFKTLIFVLAVAFASIYLTFIVDVYTLNTALKRIFVFCYFIIASLLVAKLYSFLNLSKLKLINAIALLAAITTLIFAQNAFLPLKSEHAFYIQATTKEDSKYENVVISEVTVGEENQDLSKVDVEILGNWVYDAQNDNFLFSKNELSNENLISFTFIGESVTFSFKIESAENYVRIYDDYGYDQTLHIINTGNGAQKHTVEFNKTYSIAERIIYNIGAVIVMAFVYKIFLEALSKIINKNFKKNQCKPTQHI